MTQHGFTAHGHPCCGEATVGSRPASRARCGGVDMCRDCQAAAGRIHGVEPDATPAQVRP